MKNKFLALAAFGAAALGTAIVSAPAHAQIPQGSGPQSNITVNVSVPEILYLRTITDIDLTIDAADLTGATLNAVAGSNPPAFTGTQNLEDGAGLVDTNSPFAGGSADGVPVVKTIPSAYVVWSNSPTGNYQVQVTTPGGGLVGPGGGVVNVAVNGANPSTQTAQGLINATAQNILLDLAAASGTISAGTYTGNITVEAFRP